MIPLMQSHASVRRVSSLVAAFAALVISCSLLGVPRAEAQSSIPVPDVPQSSLPEVSELAPGSAVPWRPPIPPSLTPRQSQEMSVQTAEGERSFILRVPDSYNEANPAPVLFAFGGSGDTAEKFLIYSQLHRTAGREALVIYPRSINGAWEPAPYSTLRPNADVDFVRAILDEVRKSYNIDSSRIYAAGMSNGGGMAATLACRAPELFAGVASVSGAYYHDVDEGCAGGATPSLIIHGTWDHLVHYDGGVLHGAPYFSVPELHGRQLKRNGCTGGSTQHPGIGTTRFIGEGCAAETELLRVIGGGHNWYYIPDAASEVWNFLSRQQRQL
ncbi:polyhydroxybutyrate depolymerase [Corynebacterium yudongzhengii]|uniref:Polyhydroxybutyrate depolymerase n=1 Tax=Corynebacterium yudongzhengii TaxID=2080740 RepID=A0A2U1T990_9CORY|nr:polyhydroxybutyrate depolymerase [Corynebacterium yudongzhengii]PWC02552.1 polyhydroxybutyrate depolymerase [Corynebacterium yudongzhengii]